MDKFASNLVGLFTLLFLLTSCGNSGTGTDSKIVVITPAIKGNSASLSVGDTLELQIPTIPKTGYDWQVQNLDTKILKQAGAGIYTQDTSVNSAGGIVTFQFTAIGPGTTTINLLYVNSPVATLPALSSKSLSVLVQVK